MGLRLTVEEIARLGEHAAQTITAASDFDFDKLAQQVAAAEAEVKRAGDDLLRREEAFKALASVLMRNASWAGEAAGAARKVLDTQRAKANGVGEPAPFVGRRSA